MLALLCHADMSAGVVSKAAKVVKAVGVNNSRVLADRIAEARFKLFGQVEGGGQRSGRKIPRQALKGDSLDKWYPYTMKELKAPG